MSAGHLFPTGIYPWRSGYFSSQIWAATLNRAGAMLARDTIPFRTLLAIAACHHEISVPKCRVVLDVLGTATAIRASLQRELSDLKLGQADLSILLTLLAINPDPSTPATLAAHAGVTRPAATEVLDRLERRGLLRRTRSSNDRRQMLINVTEGGLKLADTALLRLLHKADAIARQLELRECDAALAVCESLSNGLRERRSRPRPESDPGSSASTEASGAPVSLSR